MYDKNDKYKYGHDKLRYEQRSQRMITPYARGTVRTVPTSKATLFLVLIFIGLIVGSVFLGIAIGQKKSISSEFLQTQDRIVNQVPAANVTELAAALERAEMSSVSIESNIGVVGSGFVYDDKGGIITCYHVIAGASSVVVSLSNNEKYISEDFEGDAVSDVAIIKLYDNTGKSLDTKDLQVTLRTSAIESLEEVLIIGRSQVSGFPGSILEGKITTAKCEILDNLDENNVIGRASFELSTLKDSDLYAGISGGLIVDKSGFAVGIIHSKSNEFSDVGFALPMDNVKKIADNLLEKGYVEGRANSRSLGLIQVRSEKSDEKQETGLYVIKSNYEGIQEGDYISSVDGRKIVTISGWENYIKTKNAGNSIKIEIKRNKSEVTVWYTLPQKKSSDVTK